MTSPLDHPEPIVTPDPAAFVDTYHPRSYDHATDLVADYKAVIAYVEDHDRAGPRTISRELDIPEGRIQNWIYSDSRPSPVRALETATDRGWWIAPRNLERDRGAAYAALVAWMFASGSIASSFQPYFWCTDEPLERSRHRLYWAGVPLGITFKRVPRDESRTDQYTLDADAMIFGRLLFAAGVPKGKKSEQTNELPAWIVDGPTSVRRAAAVTYVAEGMNATDSSDVYQYRPRRHRPAFLEQIGRLVTDVAGGDYTAKEGYLRLDVEASRGIEDLIERRDRSIVRA